MGKQGGIPVSNIKLEKQLFLALLEFMHAYADLDYESEEEFRQMLKGYLKNKGLCIDDRMIDEIINNMDFKSWEY